MFAWLAKWYWSNLLAYRAHNMLELFELLRLAKLGFGEDSPMYKQTQERILAEFPGVNRLVAKVYGAEAASCQRRQAGFWERIDKMESHPAHQPVNEACERLRRKLDSQAGQTA